MHGTLSIILAFLVQAISAAATHVNAHHVPRRTQAAAIVNATGSVPIKGFRLDRPYPGEWDDDSGDSPRWSLQMNISTEQFSPSSTHTSITVELLPPPPGSPGALDINEPAIDTWHLAAMRFDFREMRTLADPNNSSSGDGVCPPSVLSDDCKLALREFIRLQPASTYNIGVGNAGYPPVIENVKNCTGYTRGEYSVIPLDQNLSSEAQWRYHFSGRPMGLETHYDRYGSRTFPLILVWGRANNRSETGFPEIEDGHVTIACVRVDTVVTEGSTLPAGAAVDDGDEDGSNDDQGSQGDGGNGEEEQGGQAAGEQPTGGSNALLQPSMLGVVAGVLGAVAVC